MTLPPATSIGPCILYHGNSLEILPLLKESGFMADHLIADPPYENHMHKSKSGCLGIRTDGYNSPAGLDFESVEEIRPLITPMMAALCRKWFMVFCTPEGVAPWRDEIEAAGLRYKRACAWCKPDSAPQFNGQGPAMAVENLVTAWAGSGVSVWNGGGSRNYWVHPCNPRSRDGRHPTEKPLSLMCEIIGLFTDPEDIIIDPFMGSGSTLMAAAMTGRHAVGIERDRKYFDIAVERLQADMLISRGKPAQQLDAQKELFST